MICGPQLVHFSSCNVIAERESLITAHCKSDEAGGKVPAESAAHQAPRSRFQALTLQGGAPSELEPSLRRRSCGMGRGLVGVIMGSAERKIAGREGSNPFPV